MSSFQQMRETKKEKKGTRTHTQKKTTEERKGIK